MAYRSIETGKAFLLTMLNSLVFKVKEKFPETVPKWKAETESLKLPESADRTLSELLETEILSRFPKRTPEEIEKMMQDTVKLFL